MDSGARCWLCLAAGRAGADAAAAMAAERRFSLDRSDDDDVDGAAGGGAEDHGEEEEGAADAPWKVGGFERLQIANQLDFHSVKVGKVHVTLLL